MTIQWRLSQERKEEVASCGPPYFLLDSRRSCSVQRKSLPRTQLSKAIKNESSNRKCRENIEIIGRVSRHSGPAWWSLFSINRLLRLRPHILLLASSFSARLRAQFRPSSCLMNAHRDVVVRTLLWHHHNGYRWLMSQRHKIVLKPSPWEIQFVRILR